MNKGTRVWVDGEQGTVVDVDPDKGETVKVRFAGANGERGKTLMIDRAVITFDQRDLVRD